MSTRTTPTTITFDEENIRHPAGTVFLDEDEEHAQDWTQTTAAKDSWAARERRRSSVWSKIDENNPHTTVTPTKTSTGAPRRGSILSVWKAGKDKDGRSILKHDDGSDDDDEVVILQEEVPVVEKQGRRSSSGTERKGSILSLWSKGVDENGRNVVLHDDEEWK